MVPVVIVAAGEECEGDGDDASILCLMMLVIVMVKDVRSLW